jgi:hypothetical protein
MFIASKKKKLKIPISLQCSETYRLNAQCDALIKKYLVGESESEKFRFWQEGKSEMLRLLAKRHNMRVVDITIDEEE